MNETAYLDLVITILQQKIEEIDAKIAEQMCLIL